MYLHVINGLSIPLAKLSSRLAVALCGIACSLMNTIESPYEGSHQASHCANSFSTLAFSLPGSDHIESEPHWFPVWSFPVSGCRVAKFQPARTVLLHWLASGIL